MQGINMDFAQKEQKKEKTTMLMSRQRFALFFAAQLAGYWQ